MSIRYLVASEHVTFSKSVPTVWMSVLVALDAKPDRWDLSALQRLRLGGAAVATGLLEGLDRHGRSTVQG
jgi:hypothetical protein